MENFLLAAGDGQELGGVWCSSTSEVRWTPGLTLMASWCILVHSLVNVCVCLWPFSGGPVAYEGTSASETGSSASCSSCVNKGTGLTFSEGTRRRIF